VTGFLTGNQVEEDLAESVWLPTALLPGGGVTWEPIDDNAARATLADSGISVSLDFRFNEKGEIVSVYTPARYRDVDGKPTPWEGHFRGYERMDGVMVPREGEVAWILPEGRLSYWRERIVRVGCDGQVQRRLSLPKRYILDLTGRSHEGIHMQMFRCGRVGFY